MKIEDSDPLEIAALTIGGIGLSAVCDPYNPAQGSGDALSGSFYFVLGVHCIRLLLDRKITEP